MPLIATETGNGNFSPVPEGVHLAVCCWLADLGTQYSEAYGNSSRKIVVAFELPEERIEIDGEDKPRIISRQFTLSLHEKAALRAFLEAWRGRRFTTDELAGFDLGNVLGKPCQLQILHRDSGGKTYSNIASVMPPPKGSKVPETELEQVLFSLDDCNPSQPLMQQIPEQLPEWIANLIAGSDEGKAWGSNSATEPPAAPEQPEFNPDDEIPF
jgi:hypothetical protein